MLPIPLRLLLLLAAAAVLIVYAHSIPGVGVTGAMAFELAALFTILRAMPLYGELSPPAGSGNEGTPIDQAAGERISRLTSYAATLGIAGAALFLSFWWPGPAFALLATAALWAVAWWPDELRTTHLTTSVVIKREPADVFAFVSDERNLLRYWPYYEAVEKVTPGPVGPGTQFRARVRFPKGLHNLKEDRVVEGIEEIVAFEPPRRLATRLANRPRPRLAVFTFDATPEGTRLTHSFTFLASYSSAVLGGELFARKGVQVIRARRKTTWARAKEILENETP